MLRSVQAALALAGVVTSACAGESFFPPPSGETVTFVLPTPSSSPEATNETAVKRSNFLAALRQIKAVTDEIEGTLYWPNRFLTALQQTQPHEGEPVAGANKIWIWSHTLLDEGWQINLHTQERLPPMVQPQSDAEAARTVRDFRLIVSGLRAEQLHIQDFEWMTGVEITTAEGVEGTWRINDPRVRLPGDEPTAGGTDLLVTWTRKLDGAVTLMATDTSVGRKTSGDQIQFSQTGDIAVLYVLDARYEKSGRDSGTRAGGPENSLEVEWNLQSGGGRWVDAQGNEACWSTKTATEADIPCPAGPWPPRSDRAQAGAADSTNKTQNK